MDIALHQPAMQLLKLLLAMLDHASYRSEPSYATRSTGSEQDRDLLCDLFERLHKTLGNAVNFGL